MTPDLNPKVSKIRWYFHKFTSRNRADVSPTETDAKNKMRKLCKHTEGLKKPIVKDTFGRTPAQVGTACENQIILGNLGQLSDTQAMIQRFVERGLFSELDEIAEEFPDL